MTPEKSTTRHNKSSANLNGETRKEFLNKRENDSYRRPATTSGTKISRIKSARKLVRDKEESFESGDIIVYPSTAPESGRSVDVVVVDVHNENKGSEPNLRSKRLLRNKSYRKIELNDNPFFNSTERRKDMDKVNAWENEESIDIIKEFEDGSNALEMNSANDPEIDSNTVKIYKDLSIYGSEEKFLPTSVDNSEAERNTDKINKIFEEPKRRRKRWSKNENNLCLTQELLVNSSDTDQSVRSKSQLSDERRFRPVPAPRKKVVSKSLDYEPNLVYDNAAFRSDHEEILRIETEVYERQGTSDDSQNYRQNTKIEMTNIYESYKRDDETRDEVQTLDETSDDLETRVFEADKNRDLFTSNNSKDMSRSESSVLSENERVPRFKNVKKKNQEGKRLKKDRQYSKPDSTSFDTDSGNMCGSKSRVEHSKKSKSKRNLEGFGYEERVKKRRSKRSKKNATQDKCVVENGRDLEIIEYNVDKVEKYISVTIHKADVLETDFITRHPMVKVHIVDTKTGSYLKLPKDDNHGRCSYLQSMITSKFDFKNNRSIVPNWGEELIFEYNFDEIIQTSDKQILIFFEILDLLNFAEASFKYNVLGNEGCWHKIAWAFLRPVGVDGTSHINKRLRLQLYEPPKVSKKSGRSSKCEVFNWWQSTAREKYPSTLYVTLKSVDPPIEEPVVYERLSFNDLTEIEDESRTSCKKSSDLVQLPKWNRLAAQSCKIPNNHLFSTETFDNGSFYLAFSNDGKYLASVGSEEDNYPVVVHAIPDGKISTKFIGHANFVYSLNWSNDDKYLLSVSSDQTARIWDVGNKIIQHIDMLPHPSYVYCGKFYPANRNVVITGCYDCVTRVWTKSKSNKRYQLTQELFEHKGYVNSMCFQRDGGLITADSLGVIILWTLKKRDGVSSRKEWNVVKIVRNNEIEHIVVNTIIMHPLGSRLLVHSRDNGLRIVDLATGVVLQRYKGLRNRRFQTTACLSPCGGLVICGGEDSHLTIWSLENGRRLARYFIQEAKIISCVAYHPLDHILAFSTFGSVSAVRTMNFDKNSTGINVGLNLLADNDVEDDADHFEITMKFDKTDLVSEDADCLSNKYSGINSANVSKNSRELETESKRRERTLSTEMKENTRTENSMSRQELLKSKIRRHNKCEEGLKSKSAARLNNIIEKIDRILVSTTSKRDLDSTGSSNDIRRQTTEELSSISKKDTVRNREDKVRSGSSKGRSKDICSTSYTDATIENSNSSKEFIEMQNISSKHNVISENEQSINTNRRLLGLKSRASITTDNSLPSEVESDKEPLTCESGGELRKKKSFYQETKFVEVNSDNEFSRHRRPSARNTGKRFSGSSEEKHKPVRNTDTCIVVLENTNDDVCSDPRTSDSAGTYTVIKDKSVKLRSSDVSKASDTSSSVKSSATFTIENEISISRSKSSKKNNL